MLFSILAKVALGVFVGGVIGAIATGDWIYTIVWSVALPAFILIALMGGSRKRRAGWPAGAGFALARIETALRTGREEGPSQEIDVRLTVAPADDAAYATTSRMMILTDNLRTFGPGSVHVVTRFGPERPDVVIVPNPPQEWVALAAKAQADPSLIPPSSDVPAWETATTTTPGGTKPGTRSRGSIGGRIAAIAIIAASALLVLIPAYPSIARTATNVVTGNWDGNSMLTGSYQQGAVDEIAAVVGSYEFRNVYFYDSYVIVSAPTTPGASTTDTYMWRYGRAFREGPESIQPTDLGAELFDASTLDFSMVARVVEASIAEAQIEGQDFVLAFVTKRPDAEPTIDVSISGSYENAYFTYDFEGTQLSRSE